MNTIIAKYVEAFHHEQGSATEKVKKILMHYGHTWEWESSGAFIADLIDDDNITANDIVDILADAYEMEGGNNEFNYAIRAMQICLRKAHLAEMPHHIETDENVMSDEDHDNDDQMYLHQHHRGSLDQMKF